MGAENPEMEQKAMVMMRRMPEEEKAFQKEKKEDEDEEFVLTTIGHALLDIVANVDQKFLDDRDLKLNNFCLAGEKQKDLYEKLFQYKPAQNAGGCALNTARLAKWLLQTKGKVGFIGAIGNDKFAEILKKSCENDNVHAIFESNEKETGVCGVCVLGGERSLCTKLEAAAHSLLNHLESEECQKCLEKSKAIYIPFFLLNSFDGPETVAKLLTSAVERNQVVAMNLSAPFLIEKFQSKIIEILKYVDIVFCNEIECKSIGETLGLGQSSEQVALRLSSLPKASGTRSRIVVVTHGPDPTLVMFNGLAKFYPVPKLSKIIDTNGAGDAFVGGFMSQFFSTNDHDIAHCIRAAHFAARIVIQHSGCTFPEEPDFI